MTTTVEPTTADLARLTKAYRLAMGNVRHYATQPATDRRNRATLNRHTRAAHAAMHGLIGTDTPPVRARTLAGLLTEEGVLITRLQGQFTRDERPDLWSRLDATGDAISALLPDTWV